MKVLKSRLRQWLDDTSAEFLKQALSEKLDHTYEQRAEAFEFGSAQLIQEKRAFLLGQEQIIKDMLDILDMQDETLSDYFEEDLIDDEGENEEWIIQAVSGQAETESL
jgi:hypothetical protein